MNIYNRENYILTDSPLKKDLLRLFGSNEKLTILDIGGCEGEESIRYSRIFPLATIYVFEPLPKNIKLIMPDTSIVFLRTAVVSENVLSIRYVIEFKQPFYSYQDYDYFKEFYKKLFDLLNEQFVFKKK